MERREISVSINRQDHTLAASVRTIALAYRRISTCAMQNHRGSGS
jgi:hypothetical protein